MQAQPAPHKATAAESATRASSLDSSFPHTGSATIMATFTIEKYSVKVALGTPKYAETGVKKIPAQLSTSAHGRQVMAMQAATMA